MAGKGFKIAEGYLDVTADDSKARRTVDGFLRDVNGRLHDQRGRYAKEGEAAGAEFGKGLQKGEKEEEERGLGNLAQRFGRRFFALGGMAGRLFANGLVLKAVAGLAALPSALSITGALAKGLTQIGGAIAALAPAAIGGAIFTLVTLKLAFSGVGNALKQGLLGDTQKFNEALAKLAPAAQEAVKQFVALAPAARELKRVVQNSFFAPWLDDIKPLASTYLPILRKEMAYLSGAAGVAVHQIAQLFTPPDAAAAFGQMLHNFAQTFDHLIGGLPGLVSGFFNLATAGSAWLSRLSSGFGDLTDKFSAWTAEFVDTGRFDAFVGHGLTLLGQVKDALVDVAGIINKIFNAVPGGGGIFAAFGQLADGLNRFLETAQGQQVISNFFARLQTLGGLIMDLVKGALPGLLALSDGLLKGFQALAPVAEPVGRAIGDALAALAPLLPLLGNLLAPLLSLAANILRVLAAELGPVIALFADMANQVLPMLLPMLDEFASQVLPIAIDAGKQLAAAFAPIVPVWIEMARTIGTELLKYLPELLRLSAQLVPVFIQIGKILADTWLKAFESIRPHLPLLIAMFAAFLKITITLFAAYASGLPLLAQFFGWFIRAAAWIAGVVLSIAELPPKIGEAIIAFWGWIKGVGVAVGDFFVQIGQWFADLPGKIWAFMQQIPTIVGNALSAAFDAFFYWLGFITAKVGEFALSIPLRFVQLWESVKTTFFNATTAIGTFFSQLPTAAANYFSQLWSTVTSWVYNTYVSVINWIGAIPGRVGAFFVDVWNKASSATSNGVKSVLNFINGLGPMIMNALRGAGNWLYNAGADVIHGLVNGFNSALGWAENMVKRAMQRIVDGAKAALHISSPSKVFADEVGRWIPPGIAQGISKGMPELEHTLNMHMAGLTAATRTPQVNVSAPSVAVGSPVVTLLVDGEEIAARIVTPQRVAAANVEGARRRNHLNTGRVATA